MHANLTAYDDVENLKRFDEKSFKKYCDGKLAGCAKHIAFIKKHCAGKKTWTGKVCEVGSGNSKLLYRLEKEALLSEGFGFEISNTRHTFAEKFKKYVGSKKVTNLKANVFETNPPENMDLVLGVDIVFQLFGPLFPKASDKIIKWFHKALKKDGVLLLEIMDFQYFKKCIALSKEKEFRWWEKFPEHDPFEFVLAEILLDRNKDIVWKKRFFRRNSDERSDFENVLRPYTQAQIKKLFSSYGFKCRTFPCWNTSGDIDEGGFVLMAQKI